MRKTAREELHEITKALQLAVDFPPEVLAETDAWLKAPHIDDPVLVDRTALPFVTIDNAHSKDLDQAVFVSREGDGYLVAYAIADASFYVRFGSALFAEAMRRGASYYFPGFSVPMLPRPLSEGLISLNPDGPRRAIIFFHHLDKFGELLGTRLERARVKSRGKLSFSDVQLLVDDRAKSPLAGREYEASMLLLRDVGRLRIELAAKKGLVRYRREEVSVELDGEGVSFTVMEAVRDEVELWNE
ncbi:MAG TPA: RNB domain-containing ribonuclease, partial [Archangium sp.]